MGAALYVLHHASKHSKVASMPLSVGSHRRKNKNYSAIGRLAEGTAVHTHKPMLKRQARLGSHVACKRDRKQCLLLVTMCGKQVSLLL